MKKLFIALWLISCTFIFTDAQELLRIPLIRKALSKNEKQSLISLLVTSHDQLDYPSFLESKSKIHMKNYANTQYVGTVGIGSPEQYMDVIFDTGSSNFFINSKLCKDSTCQSRKWYDHDKSESYHHIGFTLEVEFGTGVISGLINEDTVTIAGVPLLKQRLAEVTSEEGEVFLDGKFSGILGLAFDSMAAFGTVPIFDSLIRSKSLTWNVFSFYYSLDEDEESEIIVGDVDHDKYEGDIVWVPLIKDLLNYWLIEIDDILLGGESLGFCPHGCRGAVDTGTTLLSAPSDNLNSLYKKINQDCEEYLSFPDISFVIQGRVFTISPKDYILTNTEESFDDPGKHSEYFTECSLGFMPIDVPPPNGPLWVLGDIFLSNFYSIFDRDSLSIGLAKAKHKNQ